MALRFQIERDGRGIGESRRFGHFTRMTHEELIANARAHMKPFDRRNSFGASSDVFTEARVREAALVVLGSQKRDDYIEVYVDRLTGDFINATYHPGLGRRE